MAAKSACQAGDPRTPRNRTSNSPPLQSLMRTVALPRFSAIIPAAGACPGGSHGAGCTGSGAAGPRKDPPAPLGPLAGTALSSAAHSSASLRPSWSEAMSGDLGPDDPGHARMDLGPGPARAPPSLPPRCTRAAASSSASARPSSSSTTSPPPAPAPGPASAPPAEPLTHLTPTLMCTFSLSLCDHA